METTIKRYKMKTLYILKNWDFLFNCTNKRQLIMKILELEKQFRQIEKK